MRRNWKGLSGVARSSASSASMWYGVTEISSAFWYLSLSSEMEERDGERVGVVRGSEEEEDGVDDDDDERVLSSK